MISNFFSKLGEFSERNFHQEEDRWVWPAIVIALMITAVSMVLLQGFPSREQDQNQDKVNTKLIVKSTSTTQEKIQDNPIPQKIEQLTADSSGNYNISLTKSTSIAKRFLKDYILFTYGKLEANEIHHASKELINSLQSPRITNEHYIEPKITVQVTEGATETEIPFIASIDNGKILYSINIIVKLVDNKWLITKIVR